MSKSKPATTPTGLFGETAARRRKVLILPRFLNEAAEAQYHHDHGPDFDQAHQILQKWADLEAKGHLKQNETALDADFLQQVFGDALAYASSTESPQAWQRERNFAVPGIGTADGALGEFTPANGSAPAVVIELKGASTDLDVDKSNGRTAVQQLWDYLGALPNTKWGIVSNFSEIRLYHKDRGSQACESFTLQKLRHLDEFKKFWCLFHRAGLVKSTLGQLPRADQLLTKTGNRQKEVGDELYNYYSAERARLIEHLKHNHGQTIDQAIHIAQKIFDRIIFIAFCEDRGLLKPEIIKRTATKPPIFRVTNPVWQKFLDLFFVVDKGHPGTELEHGYNGGLFQHDDLVDNLQLEDDWATVFVEIAKYDFKDEVNVDVLGHLFEKSITELEKLRVAGIFGPATAAGPAPKMQKSAERKRFGIYYTPPEFTGFIATQAVGELLAQRFADLKKAHEITPAEEEGATESPRIAAYYQQCLATLRSFKVVDPACGSGAFLIAAYDVLEAHYDTVVKNLVAQNVPGALELAANIPDLIITENLYGADLSEQAVEITRLALWIKTVRFDKTLADLSRNIVWGNSLVDDKTVHAMAMDWKEQFPEVFQRPEPGFDAVIGNPPWERLKLQEREFFAFSAPEIASAVNAATRRKLIEKLATGNPDLFARYTNAQSAAEKTSAYARACGRYPLTAQGDINTYMLFAELARTLVAPRGRVGILVPSGIATDNTTKEFFAGIVDSNALIKLYDFENRAGIFPDVDGRFKFCTLILGGAQSKASVADFVFFAHSMLDLEDRNRHIALSKKDIALLNPNTHTCPIFRSRHDAELTKAVYKRIPILIDDARKQNGNPWDIVYLRMFDQTNDAELFAEPTDLMQRGFKLDGNIMLKGKQNYLPLYEAKMIQVFDHRAASVLTAEGNWVRQGQTDTTTLVGYQNPEHVVLPRWWVDAQEVDRILGDRRRSAYVALKDITSATNQRTMIAALVPHIALVNSAPLLLFGPGITLAQQACFLANLNSFAYDFIARQKVGGNHLNFFIVEQLPTLPPDAYADKCSWNKKQTLESWISERVLKLSCTANDMIPLAKACNFNPPTYVWKWKEAERAQLRAELDAAYFHLYGISRDDVIYILSTFQASGDPADPHSTAALVLQQYDRLAP